MSSPADSPAAAAAAQSNLSASQETSALHNPFKLGQFSLKHRIVLSPLSRMRSYGSLPQPSHASLYYAQRTTPGGFLIAEAASVSEDAGGFPNMPGIWSEEQVEAWQPIVKAVHDKGGVFFLQLWHPGRATHVAFTRDGEPPVSSTNRTVVNGGVPQPDGKELPFSKPRALETHEIPELVGQFRRAARNAIRAGFDGVEVHGAHGYLIDQFLKDGINDRSDEYGGSVANRARFALEVVTAVCHEIGADKVGLKVSLLPDRMDSVDSDPLSLGLYLAKELSELNILYLHVVERPLVEPAPLQAHPEEGEPLSFRPIRDVFKGAFLSASCHSRETGIQAVRSGDADLVVYGRWFVANPDLVERFRRNLPLNQYNNHTLYTSDPVVGYTDYPSLEES